MTRRLVIGLTKKETLEGLHSRYLHVLKEDLPNWTSFVDQELTRILLKSNFSQACEAGGIVLQNNADKWFAGFSTTELVEFSDNEILAVREASWQIAEKDKSRFADNLNEVQFLVKALDSKWEDSRQFWFAFFDKHLTEKELTPEKNIVSNAKLHVGAKVIVNVDLKDFFPSISYRRVKGMFQTYGFSEAIATIFALICTAPTVEEVEIDNKTYFVAIGERHLPQGSPASPMISNIIAKRLDKGLSKIAENLGFKYTRYADDLTFSSENKDAEVAKLLGQLRYVVDAQGFTVNQEKTRVLRSGRQQEITGVVVNEKLSIDRKELRKFRAVLHQAETKGLEGLTWGNSPDLIASLKGYANFVFMVDKQKGYIFQQQVRRIAEKYDWKPLPPRFTAKKKVEKTEETEKPWWKLW